MAAPRPVGPPAAAPVPVAPPLPAARACSSIPRVPVIGPPACPAGPSAVDPVPADPLVAVMVPSGAGPSAGAMVPSAVGTDSVALVVATVSVVATDSGASGTGSLRVKRGESARRARVAD